MVVELEKDIEGEACKSVIDRSLRIITVQNGAEQNSKFALPETPLLSDRYETQSSHLRFHLHTLLLSLSSSIVTFLLQTIN